MLPAASSEWFLPQAFVISRRSIVASLPSFPLSWLNKTGVFPERHESLSFSLQSGVKLAYNNDGTGPGSGRGHSPMLALIADQFRTGNMGQFYNTVLCSLFQSR